MSKLQVERTCSVCGGTGTVTETIEERMTVKEAGVKQGQIWQSIFKSLRVPVLRVLSEFDVEVMYPVGRGEEPTRFSAETLARYYKPARS